MEDDKMDIGNAMDKKAIPDEKERKKVNDILQNPAVSKNETNNSSVDGLNQAATPNNDLEPGIRATTESDES